MSIEAPNKINPSNQEETARFDDFTKDELKAGNEVIDMLTPRPEYKDGKIKLNFKYEFPGGEILSATEDKEGKTSIIITKGKKKIFDFAKIQNINFVTPSQLIDEGLKSDGMWGNSNGQYEVKIGDMRDPKDIAILLHEIGHIVRLKKGTGKFKEFKEFQYIALGKEWEEHTGAFSQRHSEYRKKLAEAISDEERTAWAEGLKIARKLKKKTGINLLEGFRDLHDLQKVIYGALLTYRLKVGQDMISSDSGLIKDTLAKIKEKIGLADDEYGLEQSKFLKGLFDKDKLKRV